MKITIADKAGFCFGVERAENIVLSTIKNKKNKVYTFGPLIHNPIVVKKLKELGVFPVEEEDLQKLDKNSTIIIRSHGIEKKTLIKLEKMGFDIVDATCPFVKKAKESAKTLYEKNYNLIILGDINHPEVKGIHSYTDYNGVILKDTDELKTYLKEKNNRVGLVAQTTQSKELFEEFVSIMQEKATDICIFDTICNATSSRQLSAIKLAEKSDVIIVIGGFNSANTKRLVEICNKICKNVIWIEKTEDLELEQLDCYEKIGITAGASTPVKSIEETSQIIQNYYNGKVNKNDE
ncbi:MAG: 4-hydroxy-3-methylbut-2-enyl diphosphate reductase [Candidatus Muirbacterium halophilum]|nr:4-hydroxy-3-methylbut-2-enyl diphosphate reductase [Candidatus Muirbacterium halophilum]MCK9475792.1 4-hydroxy-3-methylbut-2-enyl diphosphate reductase [Candidatus Muirbacterium halophilum]